MWKWELKKSNFNIADSWNIPLVRCSTIWGDVLVGWMVLWRSFHEVKFLFKQVFFIFANPMGPSSYFNACLLYISTSVWVLRPNPGWNSYFQYFIMQKSWKQRFYTQQPKNDSKFSVSQLENLLKTGIKHLTSILVQTQKTFFFC